MLLKLKYKGPKIATPADAVIYIGIFLTGKALKWFKLYLIEYQIKIYSTTHATLPKGGAALPNLRIPILPSKTIVFPTLKTQFRPLSELEVDSFSLLPPLFYVRSLGKRG